MHTRTRGKEIEEYNSCGRKKIERFLLGRFEQINVAKPFCLGAKKYCDRKFINFMCIKLRTKKKKKKPKSTYFLRKKKLNISSNEPMAQMMIDTRHLLLHDIHSKRPQSIANSCTDSFFNPIFIRLNNFFLFFFFKCITYFRLNHLN